MQSCGNMFSKEVDYGAEALIVIVATWRSLGNPGVTHSMKRPTYSAAASGFVLLNASFNLIA